MLIELYIEALLVDEELADQVWEAWDKGEIDDEVVTIIWCLMTFGIERLWRDGANRKSPFSLLVSYNPQVFK